MHNHLPITDIEYKEDEKGSRIVLFSEHKSTSHPFTPLYILPAKEKSEKKPFLMQASFSKLQEIKDSFETPPVLLNPERQFLLENNLSFYSTDSYGLPNIKLLGEPISEILKSESQLTKEAVLSSLIKTQILQTKEKNANLLENIFFKSRLPLTKTKYPKTPTFSKNDLSLVPSFLLSSHAKVQPTTDGIFYQSFLDEYALYFHKTNTNQKERFQRNKQFNLDYFPIGPLFRNQSYIIPLIDAIANSDFLKIQDLGKETNPSFSTALSLIPTLSSFSQYHKKTSEHLEQIYTKKHKILFYKELEQNNLYLYSRLSQKFLDSQLKLLPQHLSQYKEFTKELSILSSLMKNTLQQNTLMEKAKSILA